MLIAVRRSSLDKAFDFFNNIFMIIVCFITVYPFLYLFNLSFGKADTLNIQSLSLIPAKIDFESYRKVFESQYIITGFLSTIVRVSIGVPLSVAAMIFTAYPLSKRNFPHRSVWISLIVFTMFFSGGLIPSYLLIKNLNLMNSIWALVLPGLIPTYSMIIMRNFFSTIPGELEESAKIDGANDIFILIRIIIPMSAPIIATVTLWSMVSHWNAWFDCMIYISDAKKQVLQLVLRRVIIEGTNQMMDLNTSLDNQVANPESIKAATIIVATVPIIMVYPFVQKYFVKGVMVGSLKG